MLRRITWNRDRYLVPLSPSLLVPKSHIMIILASTYNLRVAPAAVVSLLAHFAAESLFRCQIIT
jgi:hypothetical protein